MKIIVTGAAGFIGSHLAERLAVQGHEVVGIDSFNDYYPRKLKELNAAEVKEKGVSILELDLAKDSAVEAISGAEIIYHLAAQPGISASTPFDTYLKNNIVATYNLLETAKESDSLKCFINVATSSVYGKHATDSEKAPPKPTSYYGVTKLAAEQLAMSYFRDQNLPACSLRLFSVYGERERPEKLYPQLIKSILDDSEFPLYEGSDRHLRSYTYIADIIDGFTAVLDHLDKSIGEIFNIGTDTAITTGEGIKIVEGILGRKARIYVVPKRPGDQEKTQANIEKARKILNYDPKTKPQEGLRKEVEWYKEKIWNKL
jgi:UDP-glucuronate 4-epimerase